MTVLDALADSIRAAARYAVGTEEAPVAVLWPDPDSQWLPLIPQLRTLVPELYALGPYAAAERQGPVIWLKCVIERALPEASPPAGSVPVLYLPGVGRQELRAGDACPDELQPLIELQYRGTTWHQRNGREWTVEAFLGSAQGLNLDIAGDRQTSEALHRALPLLAAAAVESLRGGRLDAEDFDRLAVGDPCRDMLEWLGQPDRFRASCDAGRWAAFKDVCTREFSFDPENGVDEAAAMLVHGADRWDDAWRRYAEAPQLYPGVVEQLDRVHPRDLLVDQDRLPSANAEAENAIEKELGSLRSLGPAEACGRLIALEQQHRQRRSGVWARLGRSPLALALEPLSRLAQGVSVSAVGNSIEELARDYAERGWRCDRALIDVMSLRLPPAHRDVVERVAKQIYEPWLDAGARRLQEIVQNGPREVRERTVPYAAESDTCYLFADGLRFDLAVRLSEQLESQDLRVRLDHRLAPLPTVTATAKPLATPVADVVHGVAVVDTFTPKIGKEGRPADAVRLREEMERRGFVVMEKGETLIPSGNSPCGWTEIGRIDEFGHSMNARLVSQLEEELQAIAGRVTQLLDVGWPRVTVVTDHGWLLLPGALPKIDLPASVVESRWARCAAVRGTSTPSVPVYRWHWDPDTSIAMPPGIGSFYSGVEYAHGGISPQECVAPVLTVERNAPAVRATIAEVRWTGMRCRIRVEGSVPGLQVDLRRNRNRPESSVVASPATVDDSGKASVVVDDAHEGAAAAVVVLDPTGKVVASEATTIGETR